MNPEHAQPPQGPWPPDGGKPPETRGHRIRRRALTLSVILLLIGVPTVYLGISAVQSRAGSMRQVAEARASGLQAVRPTALKRRIYRVPIPAGATRVRYYETSNWRTSRLYVQFDVTAGRLDTFLANMGTSRAALRPGYISIPEHDRKVVGWDFGIPGHDWAGLAHDERVPLPTQDVVVDLSDPAFARVYVVSATTP
jgi:hypothetical protein